uniref:Uncharacterized protein n=1 Tax=Lepeophtheirus salmonis TaxID=72036 RepID=A0A0K2UWW9_LEPSM
MGTFSTVPVTCGPLLESGLSERANPKSVRNTRERTFIFVGYIMMLEFLNNA